MEINHCPICGFPFRETIAIEELIYSFDICSCCGCEYGYDDNTAYRQQWLAQGAPWFTPREKPVNWDLDTQLQNVRLDWEQLKQLIRE